jgi:hypothetical protein
MEAKTGRRANEVTYNSGHNGKLVIHSKYMLWHAS